MIDTKKEIAELDTYLNGEDSDPMDGYDYACECKVWLEEIDRLQKELTQVGAHLLTYQVCGMEKQLKDQEKEVKKLMDGMELAWAVIANAYDYVIKVGSEGVTNREATDKWVIAADRWRDEHWHPSLKRNCTGEKEEAIEETK